jgi:SWI/SNF-related matrix-associated actin-dependent regulator 1 of chromatin subfamily A
MIRISRFFCCPPKLVALGEFNTGPRLPARLTCSRINLVAASVVVIYDQDFNPHNDRQAADRAYRIGQEKEVEVIKLISKDSIDVGLIRFRPPAR